MNWAQSFFALSGLGALLLAAGFFLIISAPWPAVRTGAKRWMQKPTIKAGVVCIVLSGVFLAAAAISLLR